MQTLWYIAKKDLLQTLKDRNAFLLSLLMPILMITVFGFVLGGVFNGGNAQVNIHLGVSNQDTGVIGDQLRKVLNINTSTMKITTIAYSTDAQVRQQVKDGNVDVGLFVPAGTTDTIQSNAAKGVKTDNMVQVYTLTNSTNSQNASYPVESIVSSIVNSYATSAAAGGAAVGQVNQICNQPGNHCAPGSVDAATIGRTVGTAAVQSSLVSSQSVGQAAQISSFDQIVPGYAVFFALFSINLVAGTILQEQEDGTFRRLMIAPVRKYELLGGKMLAQFLLTLGQLLIMFLFGFLVFHIHIGSWPLVLSLLVVDAFATTGLGMLLVSVVKSRRQMGTITSLVTLLTAAIGGAWFPLFLEPDWLRAISKISLASWAMNGLNNVMLFGKDFSAVWPDLLGLFGYGLLCLLIAMRLFRFQQKAAA